MMIILLDLLERKKERMKKNLLSLTFNHPFYSLMFLNHTFDADYHHHHHDRHSIQ